jgi:hypothetical protein
MSIRRIESVYSRPQKPLSAKQHAAGVRGGELQGGVALLAGLGADEVIADRDALDVGDQHEAHAPHKRLLDGQ